MDADELIELLGRLLEVEPEDEAGCCRYCYAWTGTDADDRHKDDCAYARARSVVDSPDRALPPSEVP